MSLPTTYVLTHDSIGVGEDGPTHEPIEQLAMLRSLPNVNVFRPADATETAAGWYLAATSQKTPTALVLTRQNLPQLAGSSKEALKGAYVIADAKKAVPDAIIMPVVRKSNWPSTPKTNWLKKVSTSVSSACPAWNSLNSRTKPIKNRSSRKPSAPASLSKPLRTSAGANTSASTARRFP